jgi:LuxR family maltose regulon positive regulatory protein
MPEQTSIAKITRPRLPKVLPRKRLFQLLDKGLDVPVTWINGPAGSGKTTLVASYLDACNVPCLWYQLDEGDSDIASFFYYLGLAAQKAAPRRQTQLPLLTMEYLRGIPTFTRRYFENLCSRLKPPYMIVLDNYHHIKPEALLHDVIRDALSVIPEGIRVTVVSRGVPPPSLALLNTYNRICFIGWEDLKFEKGETALLLKSAFGRGLSEPVLTQMQEMTTGWAAGLVLLMERLRTGIVGPEDLDRFQPREFFDYFATELFLKADQETQDFLLKTSFLPHISAGAAAELTGRENAGPVLAALSRNHFFTEQRSAADPVYQYHPLFREFLTARAKESYSNEEMLLLYRRAGDILVKDGEVDAAVDLYSRAAEWKGVTRLVLTNALSMMSQGRNHSLEVWLRTIPEDILCREPWLLYWMGVCRMPFALAEGRKYFEKAFALFRKKRDASGVFLAWSGVVESVIQELGDLSEMDPWIALLDALMKEYPVFPSQQIEGHVTARIFMALSLRQPWHPAFEVWKSKAQALVDSGAEASLRMLCGFYLLTHFLQIGEVASCERVMSSMRVIIGSNKNVSPLAYTMGKMADAWLAWATCSYGRCLRVMEEGLEKSEESGVHLWDNLLLTMGVCASFGLSDLSQAGILLDRMALLLERGRPLDKFYYYGQAGWYSMQGQDVRRALSFSTTALDMATRIGFLGAEAKNRFARAHYMHLLGNDAQAKDQLEKCRAIGQKVKSPLIVFYCLLKKATIAFAEADEKRGLQFLLDAMALGREKGFAAFNFTNWPEDELSSLCVKALEEEIEPDFVTDMIRKRNLVPVEPPLHIGNWPWSVQIHTLGRFEIVRDGKLLRFAGKVQKKPLEMLKALIAFGSKDVSEERITDALWPDAEGDAARLSFKTTLHRLRQVLGNDEFIQLTESRVSLDRRYCWVDVWAFETLVEKAELIRRELGELGRKGAVQNATQERYLDLLGKAFSTYGGHFLHNDQEKQWTTSYRERLRSKFLGVVTALGESWTAQAEKKQASRSREAIQHAIEYYQKGLEIDDVAEDFYQNLMVCYGKLGRKAEAAKVYKRFRSTLAASLGVEPSQETEDIYLSIIKK